MIRHTIRSTGRIALAMMTAAGLAASASAGDGATPETLSFHFDFNNGAEGWTAEFSDFPPAMRPGLNLAAGLRPLPKELNEPGKGFYIQGHNICDCLFMFLKCPLTAKDGVVADQAYKVVYRITFASNAPTGCAGIGGAPGESVTLKAGGSAIEPVVALDESNGLLLLNVDKGDQSYGGVDAEVVGNIANGLTDCTTATYVSLRKQYVHPYDVKASKDGDLWLLVGTDSGYEGLTGLYYQSIEVMLIPVVKGDLDGDGHVRVSDLLALLNAWGACDACAPDLDGNEYVDAADLLMLLDNWTGATGVGTAGGHGGGLVGG